MRSLAFAALLFSLLFSGCYYKSYISKKGNILTLNTPKHLVKIKLKNKSRGSFSYYTTDNYTLDEEKFHLEYIQVKQEYTWSGLAEGFYKDFLREQFKGLKKVSQINNNLYDIYTYELNGRYFYLISLYNVSSNTFIVDYTGEIAVLYSDKVKLLKKENRIKERLQKNLLHNPFNNYFEREDQRAGVFLLLPFKN